MYENREDPDRSYRVKEEALDSILKTNKRTRVEIFHALEMILMLDDIDMVDEDIGPKYGPILDRLYRARDANEDKIDEIWFKLFEEQHNKKLAIIKRVLMSGEL